MNASPLDDTLRGVGVRLDWSGLPAVVRRGIEQLLGADVVEAGRSGVASHLVSRLGFD
jgi:hypothetical protein